MVEKQSNILLVDDSRSVRSYVGEILEAAGYQVIVAVDGQDGMQKLQEHDVDLIVSDLEMPLMDGLDLCRAVKSDQRLRSIYFILLTVRTELKTRVLGLDSGADDYIIKTTHPAELIARVRAGLRIRQLERDLKLTQAHLFYAEKMASIGQLSAGLAHEINNPISFIISNLATLEKYLKRLFAFMDCQSQALAAGGPVPEALEQVAGRQQRLKIDRIVADGQELINESRDGAERIAELVGKLRSFMSMEGYECQLVDLNRALDLAVSFLQQEFSALRPPLKDFGEIPLTRCFPHQLNQVFAGLLRNAAQAIGREGEIRVASRCDGENIILTVADNGCGIPSESLHRIYDPFFTTRAVGQGAGLGLTIADAVVRKHGGSLEVYSQLGKGTSLTIHLPVQPESLLEQDAIPEDARDVSKN